MAENHVVQSNNWIYSEGWNSWLNISPRKIISIKTLNLPAKVTTTKVSDRLARGQNVEYFLDLVIMECFLEIYQLYSLYPKSNHSDAANKLVHHILELQVDDITIPTSGYMILEMAI